MNKPILQAYDPGWRLPRLFGLHRWSYNLDTTTLLLEMTCREGSVRPLSIELRELAVAIPVDAMTRLRDHVDEGRRNGVAGPTLVPFLLRDRKVVEVESACYFEQDTQGPMLKGMFRRPPPSPLQSHTSQQLAAFLEAFVAHSPSAVVVVDAAGTVISINEVCLRFFGKAHRRDVVRKPLLDLAYSFSIGMGALMREAIQSSKPSRGRFEVMFGSGARQSMYWRSFPLSLGEMGSAPRVFAFDLHEGGARHAAA